MVELKNIRLIAMDVDGVLSDGKLYYSSAGEELKTFNVQDGLGLTIAKKLGYQLAIITGRTSPMVERRAKELGFQYLVQGSKNKTASLQAICQEADITLQEVAYVGDDLNDLGAITVAGFSAAPSNAAHDVKLAVDYVTTARSGEGVLREVVEKIIKETGRWEDVLAVFRKEVYDAHQ